MDDTLWDTLAVEVSQKVDQVEVLKKKGTIANALVLLLTLDRATVGGGVDWLLVVPEGRGGLVVGNHVGGVDGTKRCRINVVVSRSTRLC